MQMLGLQYTNFYMVYRSVLMYAAISIVLSGISIWVSEVSGDSEPFVLGESGQWLAIRFIMLLMMFPTLELSKIEAKSGYDKYVLTLPVRRSTIVQSYYLFYFLSITIGVILSYGVVYIYTLCFQLSFNSKNVVEWIAVDAVALLLAGAIIFPLLYNFGVEKSDGIIIAGVFGPFIAINYVGEIHYLLERLPLSNFNLNISTLLPILLLLVGILLFLLSSFISLGIYRKKEF
ncbi:ABC-2 transporter permease [Lysinibacillus sp. NPDC093210]|uniref:ABC-2 transporter permease n=1 Tax=Lysinibacillus sp. NPDC093210 TaxID=3364133 RepID=UPI0037F96117